MLPPPLPRLLFLLTAFGSVFTMPALAAPQLLHPADGAILRSNRPTLAWSSLPDTDAYELWINGHLLETVPAHLTEVVPFPLSFGVNEWHVVARRGKRREASVSRRLVIADAPLAPLPDRAVLLREGWRVTSSTQIGLAGAVLSRQPPAATPNSVWSTTSVPATVLTALVRNGIYPNPYVELNNSLIPDAHDGFNATHDLLRFSHLPDRNPWTDPYWFVKDFSVPGHLTGRRLWLTFNEINYRAEVWLNGHQLASAETMVGMERQFRFDVTAHVRRDAINVLAVLIHPVDVPGEPAPPPLAPLADPGRNMGNDTAISLNYTKWDTVGWDWQPEVKDRDMGITEDVVLSASDDLTLADPYLTARIELPGAARADLALAFELVNHGDVPLPTRLQARLFDDRGRQVAAVGQTVTVPAGTSLPVRWDATSHPALQLVSPRLWWPADLGEPCLHRLELTATAGDQSDRLQLDFGIRQLDSRIDPLTGARIFAVNGRDHYGQGGNWVIDMLLNDTASRYDEQIRHARQLGLNQLRVWGPTGAPPPAFYAAADRAGVLIWQDFLHDHWGTDNNTPGAEPPEPVYRAASTAIIQRYRNHPSLFLWCGGNEGPNPRERLLVDELLPAHDPAGGRHYLISSLSDGLQGGGPYHTLAPSAYFGHPKLTGFNSEIGPTGLPPWESIRQFARSAPATWAPDQFPLDAVWSYHDANDRQNDDRKYSHFDQLVRQRYGAPDGTDLTAVRDYADTAQLLNLEVYRATLEALNRGRWRDSTGFALWKFNSSWPSLIWQAIDWYHRPHAGYYAFRRAAAPLHLQFNADDRSLSLLNRSAADRPDLAVRAELRDASQGLLWSDTRPVHAPADTALPLPVVVPAAEGLAWLHLQVTDAVGRTLARNLYWLEPSHAFTALRQLPPAALTVVRRPLPAPAPDRQLEEFVLTNDGTQPALLVHLRLHHPAAPVEAEPVYWSDNYLCLAPGESAVLTAEAPRGEWRAVLSAWNSPDREIPPR